MNGAIPLDPIYTGTLFLLLSNVQVNGVAVAGPIGQVAHGAWPGLFAAPELVAAGAWASAVIQPGASVLARGLAALSAEVASLAFGMVLVRVGLGGQGRTARIHRGWIAVVGALLQAHVVVSHLTDRPISLADLEATGLTFGFSVLFSGPPSERPRLTTVLAGLPEPLRVGVLALAAVAVAYALAVSLVGLGLLSTRLLGTARRWLARRPARRGRTRSRASGWRAGAPVGLVAFAAVIALSPLGSLGEAESRYLQPELEPVAGDTAPGTASVDAEATIPLADAPSAAILPTAIAEPTAVAHPTSVRSDPTIPPRTRVEIVGSDYRFSYRVNGRPQVLRGMGYNPVFAGLSAEERAARYDRDFAAMRQAGVNTIVGWDTAGFDELLLDKANQHGLGIVMPYDLSWSLDYTDPTVRETVRRDVLGWVARYKDHPAVRMWGPGNEVLHKLVFPSWLQLKGDPAYEARADAFAEFYVDLIDRIHRLDPDHPVTYRDAEDGYVSRLREALQRGGVERPWFVYGINIYTTRLAEVIANWPSLGLDIPLFVSEFGPSGAGPADRPAGYRELWKITRAQPRYVLGGAPYVWTTDGPEEADRIFGLVDASGRPVDGSLAMIGRLYRGAPATEPSQPAVAAAQRCSDAVWTVVRTTITDLQASPYTIQFQSRTPPIVIGQLDNLPPDPLRPEDFRFERSTDPERLAWQREAGRGEEWWVTWYPPSRPGDQLAMLIRQSPDASDLAYIYHGPASPSATSWRC